MTHKSEDYKISAVKYYLKNKDNIRKTCKIFDCKKSTLQRWIKRYKTNKNLTRRNRKPISYKITKPQVNTALELLKQNEQLTMNELAVDMKKKYTKFNITPQHLGQVISGNVLIHGLICCKNGCGYWNRDVNGATNIYKIAYNAINNKERPNYLSRSNNSSGSLDELPKPKFTRSAKGKPY